MSYLHKPVIYLEAKDFTAKGKLKHFKDKKCIIMAQANYCGHCTSAKPHFQQFAEKHPEVICLTIQGDGENEDEKQLIKTILKIKPSFQASPIISSSRTEIM
ncbi:hypothetical protein DH26_gp138 [Chloriridovirus anopheles1]|uniref:Thioredoxin domain-containing protein n=1 Tax=Chloriridovirus anopheles1 TaxID=1465751 RepID=W8QE91_9VIRU|nr:hypothetical protein DH26_gp138 [Anopheles minimus iridovirus]AHL67625.1 hypothetical protein AMIV_138 [Anopheles minimus iridovirus]